MIALPITAAAISIVKWGGRFFFIWLWVFAVVTSLFIMTIYPEFIAPLFDKYTPLPDGPLKTKIEELAKQVNFPLFKIYIVEGKLCVYYFKSLIIYLLFALNTILTRI